MIRFYVLFALASLPVLAGQEVAASRPVIELIDHWKDAYRNLDLHSMLLLETEDFSLFDRFGQTHLSTGSSEHALMWVRGFEAINRETFDPIFKIQQICFPDPTVGRVEVRVHYSHGIALLDGTHIDHSWETQNFHVVYRSGKWLVTAIYIRDRQAP